ncbi:MAG TPA: DUF72 domain-containing protein, partial [Gemmatimonadales bacterium]|nr:DUF72 domain-containing protein [Gemmatimonadales bacterium]
AHPPPAAGADLPGGWGGLVYFRLHGAPRRYYSAYSDEFLDRLADRIRGLPGRPTVWCVFDNTAAGEAVGNALGLLERLRA